MPIDPMTGAMVGGMIAAPVITGIMGNSAAKKAAKEAAASRAQAQANIDMAVAQLEAIGIPSVEAQQIVLQKPELVGVLTAETLGPSAMEGVKASPKTIAAQFSALEGLRQRAEQGLTPEDRLIMSQIQDSLAAQQQAQQKGILQSFAARGQAGAGQELAARLLSGQQQAEMANQSGMNLAANVAQARRAALDQMGSLAGSLRTQDVTEQTRLAQARDVINQFNLQNRQDIAAQNLALRQDIANQQANIARQQETYNKGLIGQRFNQQMQKAGAVANARVGQASNLNQAAQQQLWAGQQQAQGLANMGSGVSQGLGALAMYQSKAGSNQQTPTNNNPYASTSGSGFGAYQQEIDPILEYKLRNQGVS